jgi:hypothetical protein
MSPLQKTHLTVGLGLTLSLALYWYTGTTHLLLIPLLFGIGLIRAGITGNCPMTNLYAWMTGTTVSRSDTQ